MRWWRSDAWRLAFGTLTAWPVPAPRRVDRSVAGTAMLLAPLTILPALVLGTALVATGLLLGAPAALVAVLVLAMLALASRGLHLDGLADTSDGLSAGFERARALEVMRRGDIGPSGVAALVLVLLVDAAALSDLLRSWSGAALAALALVSSRQVLAWACVAGVPAAKPDGLGAAVAGVVGRRGLALSFTALLALGAALAVWSGHRWGAGLLVPAAAVIAAMTVVRRSVSRLGGITGDVLGATVEVALAASLSLATLV